MSSRPADQAVWQIWDQRSTETSPLQVWITSTAYIDLVRAVADGDTLVAAWNATGENIFVAREGQPLRWVTVAECRELPLLPADGPIVERLGSLRKPSEVP